MKNQAQKIVILVVTIFIAFVSLTNAAIHNVSIASFSFSPNGISVYPGDTVRWTLASGAHSTTSDVSSPKIWDSGLMTVAGTSFDLIFTGSDAPGPYPYHCTPHAAIMKDTIWVLPPPVNSRVDNGPNASDPSVNSEVAWSETNFDEAYVVWTEFTGPSYTPSLTGLGISLNASLGSWSQSMIPTVFFTESWNPSIGSNFQGGFLMAHTEYEIPTYAVASAIVMNVSPGGGAPFGSPSMVTTNFPGQTWVDYPVVALDEDPASPPTALGTGHLIWTEFIDGDGDANLDGNLFNDPGDFVEYKYTWTNMNPALAPPFLYPAFAPVTTIFGGLPVNSPSMAIHRAAMDVVTSAGPTILVPAGGIYMAVMDYASMSVVVEASTGPGAPFTVLGPVAAASFTPVPHTLSLGEMKGSSVSIAVDNGPNCPGMVYVVWSDYGSGTDADIMFSSSNSGGLGWTPPVRVNQDPINNGIDQWAPKIDVDPNTGEILVTYYDGLDRITSGVMANYVSISKDCGLTWNDCRISEIPSPSLAPAFSWPHLPAAPYAGDYMGMDINGLNGPSFSWNDGDGIYFATGWNCSCCVLKGDFNGDGAVDITDLTMLVDWMFRGGPPPACLEEIDVNGDGLKDIGDLTYFVDFMFRGGPSFVPC